MMTPTDAQNANNYGKGSKLQKQAASIYDQHELELDDDLDPYYEDMEEPMQQQQQHFTPQDYFNEEDEIRYAEEHAHSPTYTGQPLYNDDNNHYNNNTNGSGSANNRRSSLRRNSSRKHSDANNNAGLHQQLEYEDDEFGGYDRAVAGVGKKHSLRAYDDDVYVEEFEEGAALEKKNSLVHKQMSIGDDDAKLFEDEYLDEFDEERIGVGGGGAMKMNGSGFGMKKQESIMEDDPELKQLEEQQNLKNQQIQQQMQQQHEDHMEAEQKQKKSVTIEEPIAIHEKPREKRTARQRWHWAYNRIVHQQQVSRGFYCLFYGTFWVGLNDEHHFAGELKREKKLRGYF
jgi:hypothetical protein